MYEEFIKETSEFIFAENGPEKADIIFVPGNGYSQMAERAAQLYAKKYAPFVLPSGKYSISAGRFGGVLTGQKRYCKQADASHNKSIGSFKYISYPNSPSKQKQGSNRQPH